MTTIDMHNPIKTNATFYFKPRDPISALTHFIGFILAIIGMPILLIRAAYNQASLSSMISLTIFMMTMIVLYAASTSYHSFNISEKANRILKKFDHISIFYLIAGSYTPICLLALQKNIGIPLLIMIWVIALAGTIFKLFFVYCPKWVSSIIYVGMGWVVISILPTLLQNIPLAAFIWLLMGGVFYSIGAIIYALKLPLFHTPNFGNHELFHCFVLLGSLCHYILMFLYIAIL